MKIQIIVPIIAVIVVTIHIFVLIKNPDVLLKLYKPMYKMEIDKKVLLVGYYITFIGLLLYFTFILIQAILSS